MRVNLSRGGFGCFMNRFWDEEFVSIDGRERANSVFCAVGPLRGVFG